MARRESVLRGDEISKYKNKVCNKKRESHTEFMSTGDYGHLRHKHWVSCLGKTSKRQNLGPVHFRKYKCAISCQSTDCILTSKVAFMGFLLGIINCAQIRGSNGRK